MIASGDLIIEVDIIRLAKYYLSKSSVYYATNM